MLSLSWTARSGTIGSGARIELPEEELKGESLPEEDDREEEELLFIFFFRKRA